MASAELGIIVTTTGVNEAVPDLANLANQTGKTEAAVTKLATTTTAQTGKAGAALTDFAQKAGQQLQQAANQADTFAARINKALNVKSSFDMGGRGADIAAYGAELDRLRQKFNQAHAIMTSYRTTASEIRQAHAVGAIGISEMNIALERLRTTTQRQIETEKQLRAGRTAPGANVNPLTGAGQGGVAGQAGQAGNNQAGMNRMMQTNLMYQFQDIAVTTAMGMSPAMIALQQGTQLAAGMQAMGGAKEGVLGLVGALRSMFSISSILPIAVVGIGAAFIQWLSKADEGVKDLDKVMKQHAKTMEIVGGLYGEAASKVKSLFTTGGESFARAMESQNITDLQKQIKEQGGTVITQARDKGTSLADWMSRTDRGMGGVLEMQKAPEFDVFAPAIQNYINLVREGKGDTQALFDEIDRIQNANLEMVGIQNLARNLKAAASEAANVTGTFAPFSEQIQQLDLALQEGNLTPERLKAIFTEMERIGEDTGQQALATQAITVWTEWVEIADKLNDALAKQHAIESAVLITSLEVAKRRARTDDERIEATRKLAEEQNKTASNGARTAAIDKAVLAEKNAIYDEYLAKVEEQARSQRDMRVAAENELSLMKLRGAEQDVMRQQMEAIAEIEADAAAHGIASDDARYAAFQKRIDAAKEFFAWLLGIKKQEEAIELGRTDASVDAEIAAMRATTDAERIAAARESAIAGKPGGALTDREAGQAERKMVAQIEKEHADATKSRTQALDDLLKKQELEIALIGKTAGEQAALHEEFRLMQEYKLYALEHGIEMDQKVLDLIHAQTAAYGEQVDVLNQKKLIEDLMFERSLIGLSAEEAGIASRLRDTGLSTTGPEADMMRENAAMERAAADREDWQNMGRDSARDFLGSMVDAIVEGGDDMGEALVKAMVGAAQRTLDKIIDKLLDQIIEALFGVPGTGGAAGGASTGGLVGNVIGDILGTNKSGGGSTGGGVVGNVIGGLNPFTAAAAGKNPANYAPGGWGGGASAAADLSKYIVGPVGTKHGVDLTQITIQGQTAEVATKFADRFAALFKKIDDAGYKIKSLGEGGFSYRGVGGASVLTRPSRHAFGEAIDINPAQNPWSHKFQTDIPGSITNKEGLSQIGMQWGGVWNKPDTMHFQVDRGQQGPDLEAMGASVTKATEAATKSATALTKVATSSTEAVAGIGDMGSTAAKAAQALSQFPAAPTGGGGGFFGSLGKLFGGGGAAGAGSILSPQAAAAIASGAGGLYHDGGVVGMGGASRRFPNMIPWLTAPRFHDGNANLFASDEYPAVLQKGELVYKDKSAAIDSLMPELLASFKANVITGEGISKFLGSIKSFSEKVETAAAYIDDGTVISYKGSNKVNKYGELVDAKGKLVWGASDPFIDTPAGLKADPQPGGWDMGAFMRTFENAPRLHNGNIKKFGADEYPAVLRRGEPVFPSMAAAQATMGGNAFVNVHNYSGAKVTTQQTKDNKGMTIDVMVDRLVATQIDQRGTASNNAIRSKFTVTERLRPR